MKVVIMNLNLVETTIGFIDVDGDDFFSQGCCSDGQW